MNFTSSLDQKSPTDVLAEIETPNSMKKKLRPRQKTSKSEVATLESAQPGSSTPAKPGKPALSSALRFALERLKKNPEQ